MQEEFKTENVFNSVRSVYIALAAYVNKVAQEFGNEKAMELLTSSFKEIGTHQGEKLKKISKKAPLDANEAYELIKRVPKRIGVNFMIPHQDSNKVVTRLDKCPVYESAKVVGIDPTLFCQHSAIPYYEAIAKQLNEEFIFERTKVKTAENDFCEIQLKIGKD